MYSFLWKEADLAMTKTLAVSIRGNFTDELPPPEIQQHNGYIDKEISHYWSENRWPSSSFPLIGWE